jgi:alpha-ribazole phosphatase
MDLYLIRHTSLNVEKGLCYGQADIPTAATFVQEATDTMKIVPDKHNAVYVSSPSRRCIQLAEFISKRPPITDRRLLELNFGDWEKKRWEEINPSELEAWMNDVISVRCPNGESYADLFDRAREFFDDTIVKNHKSVVVITHAGIIRAILAYVLEMPFHRSFDLRIAYGSITKITADKNALSVEYINRL